MPPTEPAADPGQHWENVYKTRAAHDVSWYQPRPQTSLRLLAPYASADGAVVDVGAGGSTLADGLLEQGWGHVTSLDVSSTALLAGRARLRAEPRAHFVVSDLLTWTPERTYQAWHDRAVFHFLTAPTDRELYVAQATRTLTPGGHLVLGTFSPAGPEQCSGLTVARYDAPQLAAVFSRDFTLVHQEADQHLTPQGLSQQFTWVVLRRDPLR